MKKRFAMLLAVVMLLSWGFAMAEPVSLSLMGMDGAYLYIPLLTGGGDSLYFMVSSDKNTLYHWEKGMEAPELWSDEVLSAGYMESLEAALEQTRKDHTYSISALFMQGDTLLGLNELNGGVFKITNENGAVKYTDVVTLDWAEYQRAKEAGIRIKDVLVVGDTLYVSTVLNGEYGAPEAYLLDTFDLKTGKKNRVNADFVNEMADYKEGKLLVTVYDENNAYNSDTGEMSYPTLSILDPKDGSLQKVVNFDKTFIGGINYDLETDTLYYLCKTGIMAMPALGSAIQVNYATVDLYSNPQTALLTGNLFAFANNDVMVKSTNPSELAKVVLNTAYAGPKALSAFQKQYPDIPVLMAGYQAETADIINAGLAKDASVDIMDGYGGGGLTKLIDKGFALDLSASTVLKEQMAKMHPAVQEMCMRDGKLFAFPINVYAPALCLQEYAFKDIPFKMEDYPTNYIDMIAFISDWGENYLDEYPDVLPYEGDKEYLFYMIQNDYITYYDYLNQPLSFDTDLFRTLIAAFDGGNFDYISEMGDARWNKRSMTVDFGNPLSGNSKRLGMRLTSETPYVATVDMGFVYVNVNSKNPELAIKLLEYMSLDYDSETKVILFPELVEAFEVSNFEKNMASYQTELDLLKERLKLAEPSDRAEIEENMTWYEDAIANPERFRYEISPEVIAQYRELVKDNLVISTESVLYASEEAATEIRSLMDRYFAGQISGEEYIQKLEKIVVMIQNEQK